MEEIRIRMKIAEIVSGKYASRVLRRGGSPIGFIFAFVAAIAFAIFVVRFAVDRLAIGGGAVEAFAPLLIGAAVAIAFLRIRGQRKLREIREAPLNDAITEVWVDAEGIHTASEGSNCNFAWSHIIDVMQTKDAILVLLTPNQYLALPHDKLPEGVTPKDALAQIQAWRGAHPFT